MLMHTTRVTQTAGSCVNQPLISLTGSVTSSAIYWTLGHFLKPLATINLLKSPTILDNFCKGVKIYHFSSEIFFEQLL